MLQLYLLIDKDINTIEKNILEKYNDVIIEKKELSKTEKIAILSISYLGDNISNAKKLSLIDEYLEQFNPTILENDAACFLKQRCIHCLMNLNKN